MHHRKSSQDVQVVPLWRNMAFLLVWSGQMVSTLGSSISALALPLLVLALTHSPALAGLLAATRQIPYLLVSLPAGAFIDRWERKKTMICCDLLRWLVLGSVPLAFVTGHLTLIQLYLVALVEGTAYVLFSLAQIAALPQLVESAHLSRAYALDTATEYVGTLAGPGLGAFIISLAPAVAVGAVLAYLVDSISYLVSVGTLLGVHVSFQVERVRNQTPRRVWREIAEGLHFLWSERSLRNMAFLTASVNFLFISVDLGVIVLAQSQLHLDVQFIGLILSMGGIGGLLGSVLAPWLQERLPSGVMLSASVIVWIATFLLLTLFPLPAILLLVKFLNSLSWPAYGVTVVSYRLALTPDHLQGRVSSAFRCLTYGVEPLGSALGGFLLVQLGPQAVFAWITAGFAACALFAFWSGVHKL